MHVISPNKQVKVNLYLTQDATPAYTLYFKDEIVLRESTMGFELKDAQPMRTG